MHHLAIECSGFLGSVAIFQEDQCLAESLLPAEVSSVQALAPAIARMHQETGYPSLGCLSVTIGPGSFTSLRVGLATVQSLGFAWRVPVVPICSLQAIAVRGVKQLKLAPAGGSMVIAVMNAFRKQVFAAAWRGSPSDATPPGDWQQFAMPQVMDAEAWIREPVGSLQCGLLDETGQGRGEGVLLTGPGLESYRPESAEDWKGKLTGGAVAIAPADVWCPTAADVGQLAWQAYRRREFIEPQLLRANYVRASAAEEKARGGHGS